jgi:hypothetical protein
MKNYPKTKGICPKEIKQRKEAGEYLCCAWPKDREGAHQVKDCLTAIQLDKGTADYSVLKHFQEYDISSISKDESGN